MESMVIQTNHLHKSFGRSGTRIIAVDDVSLEVPRGSIYGFLGPNGAGKTTTIRMLLGLMRPERGEVFLFGKSLQKEGSQLLGRVGALVEAPMAFGHLSGRENLEYIRRLRGGTDSNVSYVLDLVGLRDSAHRPVKQYSLGMKQRLGIAAALLNGPEVLMLDEPMNGLDPVGISEMRALMRKLVSEYGLTIFLSSHILSEVELVATHIGIINTGKLRFQGSLDELRARTQSAICVSVDDRELAMAYLKPRYPVEMRNGREIVIQAPIEEAGVINRHLVESGITVTALNPVQASLEQAFLAVTHE